MMKSVPYNRPLNLIALVTAAATFPLIFMGGRVTTNQAGMAVPDWPNTYGYNMFLFPPSEWIGGVWDEHVHRLVATLVGFLAVTTALLAWGPAAGPQRRRWIGWGVLAADILTFVAAVILLIVSRETGLTQGFAKVFQHVVVGLASLGLVLSVAWLARKPEPRRWVRWLAVAVLVAVCVQGLLGGMRVDLIDVRLAIVHGIFAQTYFCLVSFLAMVTGRWWMDLAAGQTNDGIRVPDRRLAALGVACLLLIFAQLIVGATMRHYEAGLAIPDLPLAYGRILPPMDQASLTVVNQQRAGDLTLRPVTLGQIWLHYGHRIGAVAVTAATAWLMARALRRPARFTVPALALGVLLVTQVTLGVLTVLWRKPADIASLHVAVGALTLVATMILTVRAIRLDAWSDLPPQLDTRPLGQEKIPLSALLSAR
jgi:cytochrome c oxidase assembly protein subunit 15